MSRNRARVVLAPALFLLIALPLVASSQPVAVRQVTAGDTFALVEAVRSASPGVDLDIQVVRDGSLFPPFEFSRELQSGETLFPPLASRVRIRPAPGILGPVVLRPSVFVGGPLRLAEVRAGGFLQIERATIQGFSSRTDGGAFRVTADGVLKLSDCLLTRNSAGLRGGVVSAEGRSRVVVERCLFESNGAVEGGGALATTDDARLEISNSGFLLNTGLGGCALLQNARSGDDGVSALIRNSIFAGGCGSPGIELLVNRQGRLALQSNSLITGGTALRATAPVRLYGNLLLSGFTAGKNDDPLCAGVDSIDSLGFNLSNQASCGLDAPTDQPATPANAELDESGVLVLKEGSGAIEGASAELQAAIAANLASGLPCGYKDARGLGRPQDADLDGEFRCDIGNYEVQGGADLTAGQSAAYLDPARPGEGVFLEVLPDGRAFAGLFTYRPDGGGPAWLVGVGEVVGNSVVVDELLEVTGGRFGRGFDSDAVRRQRAAGMSLVFSTCGAEPGQAKLSLQAEPTGPYSDLLVDAARLSTVVPCTGPAPAAAGRSGSFFDPQRDGEGIFVQWLTDGRVVLIWYTFDRAGEPLWIISGDVIVEGDRVTAQMLYPVGFTRFGSAFDPAEIELADWGELTLEYTGCDSLRLRYVATAPDFGQGQYEYVRATRLAGTTCSP